MVNTIKKWWNILSPLPLGTWIFSRLVGFLIPYTGTACPNIVKIAPGFAEVNIRDKRRNRNHLRSIHALALANLGELTTGLALHFALDANKRAILTNLNIEFLKKARGVITARATLDAKANLIDEVLVQAHLSDQRGDVVAKVTATWLVGIT